MSAKVIEYVVRSARRARAEWSEDRRRTYLLRQDVSVPISIDRSVLPDATPGDSPDDVIHMMVVSVSTPGSLDVVQERWAPRDTGDIVPGDRDPVWRALGYDVCDDSGLSAIMNCGYEPGEREKVNERWSARLNEHHLFDVLADADAFRALSNERVREHAPFVVVRLHLRLGDPGRG